jgi:hypothetical protein
MQIRRPIVAGQFYPGQPQACRDAIEAAVKKCEMRSAEFEIPAQPVAGIVPHAGWTFSGDVAAMVFSAIKQLVPEGRVPKVRVPKGRGEKVDTFVICGAAHGYFGASPAVDDSDFWETPLGNARIDKEIAESLLTRELAVSDSSAHRREHSIEVQVPFIRYLFPDSEILPIIVPPGEQAISLGEGLGDIMRTHAPASRDACPRVSRRESGRRARRGGVGKTVVCIGSTDLTHYGPRYGFTPMGTGSEALQWASKVNDQRFIDAALKLDARGLLAGAAEHGNACGPGAAAAAIAAAKVLGKTKGVLLAHTNSSEAMLQKMHATSLDSVGYAAIVF